jgi:hypothetical protein
MSARAKSPVQDLRAAGEHAQGDHRAMSARAKSPAQDLRAAGEHAQGDHRAMSARAKSPAAATRPAPQARCGAAGPPERSEWRGRSDAQAG